MRSNAFSPDNVRCGMLHFHTAAWCIIVTRSHYGNTAPEGRQTERRKELPEKWRERERREEEVDACVDKRRVKKVYKDKVMRFFRYASKAGEGSLFTGREHT